MRLNPVRGAARTTVRAMNTPALLARTILYVLGALSLAIVVLALAVPGGASWLVVMGFITPYYETNVFAVRLFGIPGTDPTVYVSVQSLAQMLMVALAVAGVVGLVRTNPWQHGVLPDSASPGRDRSTASASPPAAPASPPPPPPPPPSPPGSTASPPASAPPAGPRGPEASNGGG